MSIDGRAQSATIVSVSRGETDDEVLRAQWEARRGDFAREVELVTSRAKRLTLWVAGTLAIAAGLLGVFLPVLPTTPFMILAAACFFRSSPRLYDAVLSNRVLGPVVYEWRQRRTIPWRAKAAAVTLIVVTMGLSIAFVVQRRWAQIAMAALGALVITWIVRVPARRDERRSDLERQG